MNKRILTGEGSAAFLHVYVYRSYVPAYQQKRLGNEKQVHLAKRKPQIRIPSPADNNQDLQNAEKTLLQNLG